MPTIIKPNYKNLLINNLDNILSTFSVKGFVISNISGFELLSNYISSNDNYTFVANYTMNVFNEYRPDDINLNIGVSNKCGTLTYYNLLCYNTDNKEVWH